MMIVEEIIRARELTRKLKDEIALSSAPSAAIDHLFEDIFGSFSDILNKMKASSHPVDSDERDGCDGNKKRRKQESKTNLTTIPYDDGYQWKKYGQKHIHKSKFPRSYYRCSNRKDQGCPATKTVQRKDVDVDPPTFIVTFGKQHTCRSAADTCPPVVMDSSRKATADVVWDSNVEKEEDGLLLPSSVEELTFDDMLLSDPVTPIEDAMWSTYSPAQLWGWESDWSTVDGSSDLVGFDLWIF